ncbi:Ger(x)C family spore germination protein [Paenibacillus tepidiphilus]|uniref:Ger(x)C family spore germination protein n=1 Tax=Paenibacillus tepidiphilus TaxID=2608683 RepID=UPI00123AD8E8|nr:Ger(x)C family spore germination protein [Paenibacillus tepidiphilus]
MKKLLCAMIALLLLCTGCEYKDIDRRIFVVAIGIDQGEREGNFKVSLKLALPQGDVSKIDEKMQILTEESTSISEALRRMKSRVEKELDYVHCKSLVLGEGLAAKDIRHVLDWAIRRRDIQLILNFAIGRPGALEVLEIKPPSERIPSNSLIVAMSGQGTESPFITSVYAFELVNRVYEQGVDPVLPVIEAKGKDQFLIDKVAVLDKSKVSLVLTADETRLFNLLTRQDLRTNLPARVQEGKVQYYTETSSSSYQIIMRQGEPVIRYNIKIKGIIEENSTLTEVNHRMLKEVSSSGGEELRASVEALLIKVQQSGLDPFGWGLHYCARHWNNESELEEWERMVPRIRFEVMPKVEVKYSGMIE